MWLCISYRDKSGITQDIKSLHKRDSRTLELSVARPNITVRKYSEKKIEFIRSRAYISG